MDQHQRRAAEHQQHCGEHDGNDQQGHRPPMVGRGQVHQFADQVVPVLAAPQGEGRDRAATQDHQFAPQRLSGRAGQGQFHVAPGPVKQHAQAVADGQAQA